MYIIIKYEIDGIIPIIGEYYRSILHYDKCSQIQSLEDYDFPLRGDDFLKSLDGKEVEMKYYGVSRVDNSHIFMIDAVSTRRSIILNDLLE